MPEGVIHHVSYREPLVISEGYPEDSGTGWFDLWQFEQALDRAQVALLKRTSDEGYDLHGPISWRIKWDDLREAYLEFRAPVAKYR